MRGPVTTMHPPHTHGLTELASDSGLVPCLATTLPSLSGARDVYGSPCDYR